MAHADISADLRKNTAYGDCRILLALHEDHGQHGSGCGLSVGSGYTNGRFVVFHNLTQQFCTGQHGKRLACGFCKFRIVRMDGSRVDDHINARNNIGSFLTVKDLRSFGDQVSGKIGFLRIRTGYGKSFLQKNFRKTTHTDAADADKMYMAWLFKVYLIHENSAFLRFYFTLYPI